MAQAADDLSPAPFIPYADAAQAPARLRQTLNKYVERMGFLPNAVKLYIHRPEIAETLFDLNNKVMRDPSSTLDQGLKRKLGAVASKVNGCRYCTAHHCTILSAPVQVAAEGWMMDDGDIRDMLRGTLEPENEMEQACFDFVRAASRDPRAVPVDIRDRLARHLTPPQIIELACLVGFWKFYNTVHDSLAVPIEENVQRYIDFVDV